MSESNVVDVKLFGKSAYNKWRLYPVGDLHCDTIGFDEYRCSSYLNFITKDPNGIICLVGDYVEGRVPGMSKYDPDAMIKPARENVERYYDWALDRTYKILKVLSKCKGRVFMCRGNHDVFMRWTGFTAALADRLKAIYLGDEGWIRLSTGIPTRSNQFSIYISHGSGGGELPGAKLNKIQRMMTWIEADAIIQGHVHDNMIRILPRIGITTKGTPRLMQKPVALIRAPAFLRRVGISRHSYVARHGYSTSDEGLQYVENFPTTEGTNKNQVWRNWQRHEFAP